MQYFEIIDYDGFRVLGINIVALVFEFDELNGGNILNEWIIFACEIVFNYKLIM